MPSSPTHPSSDSPSVSCGRCRRRKIRCNRRQPCAQCSKAGVECTFPGGGVRQRPAPRRHMQALEKQVSTLESFIQSLAVANNGTRQQMLTSFQLSGELTENGPTRTSDISGIRNSSGSGSGSGSSGAGHPSDLATARTREGRLRRLSSRPATQFYGSTSLFQPHAILSSIAEPLVAPVSATAPTPSAFPVSSSSGFPYDPHDDTCRQLMAAFFQNVYHYYFCVYREYFLRDYAAGGGPYYADMLMFCICALGALTSPDPERQALATVFAEQAESLMLALLHQPELTMLQSLLLLAQLEIGRGRGSKGWLFCGMACRLTHEMGLHLDPANWADHAGGTAGGVDREILRRVYWAAFIVDKQLSLFFGRPPALYPHEADVRNTIRIPYPPEWQNLLDTYISRGTSATAFEDGVLLVGAFVHQAELAKILHRMIVDVFERRGGVDPTDTSEAADHDENGRQRVPETALAAVHDRLVHWLARLPQKLHWHPWTAGPVTPYVLHLHMLFHTAMIILHRPPWRCLMEGYNSADDDMPPSIADVARSEDVEICYESLAAILRLLRSCARQNYRLELLPLDFVHTLSAAAGVVVMRRYLERLAWSDSDVAKPLALLLDAMRTVEHVYPCIVEIREGIEAAAERGKRSENAMPATAATSTTPFASSAPSESDFGFMHILETGAGALPHAWHTASDVEETADLGFLVTDDFLNETWTRGP